MFATEIVTTGTEILLGDIVDTNAAWIAQQLREAGINLFYKTTVGDNEARIRGVIELGMTRSDAIVVTGGLGPTVDDVTRHAIAAATGRPLILHEGALSTLLARFARFGVQMTDNNRQQALIPAGALLIENPVGTAPGFIVETERCAVIAVPGVPSEMKQLMQATVLPYLRTRAGGAGVIRRRILRTFGIGESTIDHVLGELMVGANPTVGLAAHTGQCDVRIAAQAAAPAAAEALLDTLEAEIREKIGRFIYSTTPGEAYETVLARHLQQTGTTVAILETNTGGAVAARLAQALPAFNPVQVQLVAGVDPLPAPVASLANALPAADEREAAAAEAAKVIRAVAGATVGVALIGTAGEGEGVFSATPGETWIGAATAHTVQTRRVAFGGQDEYTTVRLGNEALRQLREQLG